MPIVNIPNVGTVNFPDDMSHEQIVKAIESEIMPGIKKAEEPKAETPKVEEPKKDEKPSILAGTKLGP